MDSQRSQERLLLEIANLRQEVERLKTEKIDLEILLETITEHADEIEVQWRASSREVHRLCRELALANHELKDLAHSDGLTGLANRRRFDEYLEMQWRRMICTCQPLSLILADVDCFKRYNDIYGHQAGDECLKKVSQTIRTVVKRSPDLVARYGGEEVAIVLPNTDGESAFCIAQSVCKAISNLRLPHLGSTVSPYVTMSLGVASCIPKPDEDATKLVAKADIALYQAKDAGRDRAILSVKTV
ncbi:MAG: diguanylate cyclase [Cyanobacteriota bacterium]|nr:diguanylate cyclase [Cyanobacteriota bacterium]